jgi:hypothetical protein
MHGGLRLRISTDAVDISSSWSGLENPQLDPDQLDGPIEEHPSSIFRAAGPDKWATVRVDGKDWSRVLSVGRLDGRVIASFLDGHALILYVFVSQYDDEGESVLTVRIIASLPNKQLLTFGSIMYNPTASRASVGGNGSFRHTVGRSFIKFCFQAVKALWKRLCSCFGELNVRRPLAAVDTTDIFYPLVSIYRVTRLGHRMLPNKERLGKIDLRHLPIIVCWSSLIKIT